MRENKIINNSIIYLSRVDSDWYGISIESEDDENLHASLKLIGFTYFLSITLPPWICPAYRHEYTNSHSGLKSIIKIPREFGITKFEDHITIRYGVQDECGYLPYNLRKYKGFFIPWRQWKFIAHRIFDTDQNLIYEAKCNGRCPSDKNFDLARENAPKKIFIIEDFDGAIGEAECHIEEREWTKGVGLFSWLRWFIPNEKVRSIDISYNIEIGKRKDSWKGGIIGCGINLLPAESLIDGFMRHCKINNIKFIKEL